MLRSFVRTGQKNQGAHTPRSPGNFARQFNSAYGAGFLKSPGWGVEKCRNRWVFLRVWELGRLRWGG